MRILVFGATGGTGREVVLQGAARGHQVAAFVRDPKGLGEVPAGVEVVEGQALDAGAVAAALRGRDAVVTALGTRPWRHTDICSLGTANIIAAMQSNGVKRIVCVSSLGVAESLEYSSFLARQFFRVIGRALRDKAVMEESLRQSGLDWVVVRPTILRGGPATGQVRAAVDASIGAGSIRRADVAAFCLDQLASDQYLHALPVITGA